MPGRINRLFRRNSQGGQNRRSAFADFFNKYFKCCFTVEKSEFDGDVDPTTLHRVWIKIPPHIHVILLRIMYGIAVDPLLRGAIAYSDSDPQFDILIHQYARVLILLDGSYFEDSSIFDEEDVEPDHMAALNFVRKWFSMGVIHCVPALKQPLVVEGTFGNSQIPKLDKCVHTRAVQKARFSSIVNNLDQTIGVKPTFINISKWHHAHPERFSTTESFHLANGCFNSMTKSREPRVMRVTSLGTVEYNIIGSIHLKTRFPSSIELPTQLTARQPEKEALSLVRQPRLTNPCMLWGDRNQCRDVCHLSYSSTLRSRSATMRPFTLTICCDSINNTLKVSFKCFQYSMDMIFEGEQARSIFSMIARMWILFVGGNVQNGFENRCVEGAKRKTTPHMWLLDNFLKAMCDLLYSILFRNQQPFCTPAIMAPPLNVEYQAVLTILNEKCCNLEILIMEEKRGRELLMKEFDQEKENSEMATCELNNARKEHSELKEEFTRYQEHALQEIDSERKRLNEKCFQLENIITETQELLMKEFKKEKEELKNACYERDELRKEFDKFRQITSTELEAANNRLKHERNKSASAACDINRIEGVLKIKESDLLNADKEIDHLRQQLRQKDDSASKFGDINRAAKAHTASLQNQLNHAEKEMQKYESKYRDTKAQLKEAKKSLKNKQPTDNASNHGCTDCHEKVKQLQVLQNLVKKKENEAREMFEDAQRLQQTVPVHQPAEGSNSKKNKTELLMDLLPAVNIINENDLKPVMTEGKSIIIGEGAFGQVSVMKYVPTDSLVAVKTIFNSAADDIILEGRAMQLCSAHPSFPVMLGIVRDTEGTPTKLVSTFVGDDVSMKSMSLQSAISKKFVNFNKASVKNILLNVSAGMGYLHKHNIVHNDIKSENILLAFQDQQWVGKIIDLGGITSPLVEPPAAEAASSDIFALSMVMCEVAQATKWHELNKLAMECKKTRPPIDDVISLISLLNVC